MCFLVPNHTLTELNKISEVDFLLQRISSYEKRREKKKRKKKEKESKTSAWPLIIGSTRLEARIPTRQNRVIFIERPWLIQFPCRGSNRLRSSIEVAMLSRISFCLSSLIINEPRMIDRWIRPMTDVFSRNICK